MSHSKLRRQIAWQAAKLMYDRQESEYFRAKQKASRLICKGWIKPKALPSNAEIRDEIQKMARMLEGQANVEQLFEMRIEAVRMMRLLGHFKTRLIGSVLTGHIRNGSDIDLHVFCDNLESITGILDGQCLDYDIELKPVVKNGERTLYKHVHVRDRFEFELTVYPTDKTSFVFKSSITGKAIERASEPQLLQQLAYLYPDVDLETAISDCENKIDKFQVFYGLLLPLEKIQQSPTYHPEGDALYHSLQVYDLASNSIPYDEDFLLAALLHDVGKGIDPYDHVAAGLDALRGFISKRTHWLIEHHMEAHKIHDRSIGARAKKRLQANESYDDLLELNRCDRAGRKPGVAASELEDALDYIRGLATTYGY
jgi:predicted HD phosphohydrolase/predicted nucleotidyltransferase